jgi:hypothetical protein
MNQVSQAVQTLLTTKPKITRVIYFDNAQCDDDLKALIKEATSARHNTLQSRANSDSHPQWAATFVCESWPHKLN